MRTCLKYLGIIAFFLGMSLARQSVQAVVPLEFSDGRLTVQTPALRVTVMGGAVVGVENLRTGETYTQHDTGWEQIEEFPVGLCIPMKERSPLVLRPTETSPVTFEQSSSDEGTLVYRGLSNGTLEDTLRLTFKVEQGGDILFRMEARLQDPCLPVSELRLPFVGIKSSAIILGCGTRFARNDPAGSDTCVRMENGLFSPAVGVIEGHKGVVGLWPEARSIGYDNLTAAHTAERDVLTPCVSYPFGARDPDTVNEPGVTRSSWWRLAALPDWLAVARGYRAHMEKQFGFRPLWEQEPEWVRNIHAVCAATPGTNDPAVADKFYSDLAARFDSRKLLLFRIDDRYILFGDNRFMTKGGGPTSVEINALKAQGFRWIGYHPYILLKPMLPNKVEDLLRVIQSRGGLPEDYCFQPAYDGPQDAQQFVERYRPYISGYDSQMETARHWVMHPGAQAVRQYLAYNLGDYCRRHQTSGAYLDILGADPTIYFSVDGRQIMDWNDGRRGENLACAEMKRANPDAALMSEYQSEWTIGHTFYSWEGETHLTHPTPVHLNHPLRAACWGSYSWTHCQTPDTVALMAGLPELNLHDDWSRARVRLYIEEELFHDLPERWESQALAYLRGRNGSWFQYRMMPWGWAYVKLTEREPELLLARFTGVSEFPINRPARIQNWVGYRDNRPIGLNPEQNYNVMFESPTPSGDLWVTELPKGTYITGIRHGDGYSVVEFGAMEPSVGKIVVKFFRKCLGVSDAKRDFQTAFEAGATVEFSTALPGALVFRWEDIKAIDTLSTQNYICKTGTGHLSANGTPYNYFTYRSHIHAQEVSLISQNPKLRAVAIGPGLHRGYADRWVRLPANSTPVFHFNIGYPASQPVVFSVRINGTEAWRETVKDINRWVFRSVSLTSYAGRMVLITLSAEEPKLDDVLPRHELPAAYWSDIHVTTDTTH